ncbi:MAG: glycosyltransferase family 2 protein [Prevotellaceae bacterium]|jgi:glycosyltransferase involved in cell wall biosynthesis|nr:glycosyltransferase family 2 protein [Prevotellaceae bacterium]
MKSVGVIISTYNNPQWLEKTLWGYLNQTCPAFELIIADDGSGIETKELIESYKKNYFPFLKHIWHEDKGFRKTRILNQAVIAAASEYLIFADQDCIPRNDFIETHIRYAQEGYMLSGGCFRLPMPVSISIKKEDIDSQEIFSINKLKKRGLKIGWKNTKLIRSDLFSSFMNFITPTKATWNGGNSSAWRKDIIAVNGFNEDMRYGGEDREFGERLFNLGIKPKQIRYSAICLHLDHARPYKQSELIARNKQIRREVRKNKIIQTQNGINQHYNE